MASKSSKPKAPTCRHEARVLSANLSNSTFGFLPAAGSKGKSPAGSSRSVNIQPDLDLIGGFAFLSFASLAQLETHIEHNEAKFAVVSVDVEHKRKAEESVKPQGNNSELDGPSNKKKATTTKKKPAKKISSSSTTNLAAKPKESLPQRKDKIQPGLDIGELTSHSSQIGVARSGLETLEQSPNSELEISLLCSETVPELLGDEEEIQRQNVFGSAMKAVANSDKGVAGHGSADTSSIHVNDDDIGVLEGTTTANVADPKPKKKKKKRKSEHCDQTSQTKFRIKKKKKPASQNKDLVGSSNVKEDELKNHESLDTKVPDDDNNKAQTKALLSRPKIEKLNCARTTIFRGTNKNSSFKSKLYGSGLSSSFNSTSGEMIQVKSVDRISLDGCTPTSSDREIDVGDFETKSISVYSDISDHSSDIELFDPHGCFLLNNKVDKVEKEDFQEGDEIVDVDIETVEKEAKKNFLVVSGIEAGHFSYHPGVTKEGTIDTSIQAYPNEIDIFLKCAKMQEGQMIKIINPDESLELDSHFAQKSVRDPSVVKATRSATERKRRHHLGDLFHDMKVEVFTDLMESDLYFSKQAILSKAISTLEGLEKEQTDLSKAKKQLLKQNKKLKEKRNMLMFSKASADVDNAKVEAILNQLNISVEDVHEECSVENTNMEEEDTNIKQDAASESNTVVEPSAKGRPRAKKSLLPPWLFKPALRPKDDSVKTTANAPSKASAQALLEMPIVTQTETVSSQSCFASKTFNVSCGVQTYGVESGSSNASGTENPSMPQIMLLGSSEMKSKPYDETTCQEASELSVAVNSPKVIHTVTSTPQAAPAGEISNALSRSQAKEYENGSSEFSETGSSSVSKTLLTESSLLKSTPLDQPSAQEVGPKPSLVKILPKPAILQLNPTQQKAIMESLGQIKQPSSDKIICNLSRLSTQVNPSTPSRFCIIRSGQLMKSLDSKNVMHLKITNDQLRNLDTSSSTSTVSAVSSQPVSSDTNTAPNVLLMSSAQTPEALTTATQTQQKHPEKNILASVPSQPVLSEIKTVPGVLLVPRRAQKLEVSTSTTQLMAQKQPEKTMLTTTTSSQAVSSAPNVLLMRSVQQPEVSTPTAQIQQKLPGKTMPATATASRPILSAPNVLLMSSNQRSEAAPTTSAQIPQNQPDTTVLAPPISSQPFLSDTNTVPNILLMSSTQKPEAAPSSLAQMTQKQPAKTIASPATSSQSVSSDIKTVPSTVLVSGTKKPEAPTSTAQMQQKLPRRTMPVYATANKPILPAPNVLLMGSTQISETPTSMAPILQNQPDKTMLTSAVSSQPVSSNIKILPAPHLLGSTKQFEGPTSTAHMPQKYPKGTLFFSGQQLNLLPSKSGTETLPSGSQASADMTLRALASLNQLQANKPLPPLSETVTNPLVPNKNPVTGYLVDLKNVVMNVGSGGGKNQPTSSFHTIPIVTITTSFKTATTSKVSVTSSHKSLEKCVVSTVCSTPFVFIPSSISLNSSFTSSSTSLQKCAVSTVCSTVSASPLVSIPSSISLNSSFTMSAVNQPVLSTGINTDLETSVPPLISTCLDPFNLVPNQLPISNPAIPSEPSVVSSSLDVSTEVRKQVNESKSTVKPLLIPDDIFQPETSSSTTVLTQEMLNIPGIKQNPDLSNVLLNPPELPLPDIFPNLDEIDKTIDAVKLAEPPCVISKEKPGVSDTCSSGTQADTPTYSLRSSSTDASKQTSPLRVAIRDFKKDKPLAKK